MHNRLFGLFAAQSSLPVRRNYMPRCLDGVDLPYTGRADGAARVGATLFSELLNAVFANVGQRAVRTVARQTFEHLLNLDLKFHLSRQTGGLTRAIDRGTKCVLYPLFPPRCVSETLILSIPIATTEESRSSCKQYFSEWFPRPLKYLSCVVSWCASEHTSACGS